MYIPIAVLFNDKGVLSGIRFLQWSETGKFVSILKDTACFEPERVIVRKLFKYRVQNVGVQDLTSLSRALQSLKSVEHTDKALRITYASGVACFFQGFRSIAKITVDGSVFDDTVMIFKHYVLDTNNSKNDNEDTDVSVVDSTGHIKNYKLGNLYKLCRRAGIAVGNGITNMSHQVCEVRSSLDYASKSFIKQYEVFSNQCALLGYKVMLDLSSGEVSFYVEKQETLVIPDIVDSISISSNSKIRELYLPEKCNIHGLRQTNLVKLRAPLYAREFYVWTHDTMTELTFPKVMKPVSDDLQASFHCVLFGIPMSITELDQSEYDLATNWFEVRGRNQLRKIIFSAARVGTTILLKDASALNEIQLVQPCRDFDCVATVILGTISEDLRIKCTRRCCALNIQVGLTSGLIRIGTDASGAWECTVTLSLYFSEWVIETSKKLVLVLDNYLYSHDVKVIDMSGIVDLSQGRSLEDYGCQIARVRTKDEQNGVIEDFLSIEQMEKRILIVEYLV